MSLTRPHNLRTGFTLVELLIGTIVSAVLLGALYSVFHGLLRMQSRVYAALEEVAPRSQAIALLQKDLANIVAPNGLLCGPLLGQPKLLESRHSDTLEFYTTTGRIDTASPWGDVLKVNYALVETADTTGDRDIELQRTATRNLLTTNADEAAESAVLLHKVSVLEFQYFDGEAWLDSWDSTTATEPLPHAIRVHIELESNGTRELATAPLDAICEVVAQNPPASAEGSAGPTDGAS